MIDGPELRPDMAQLMAEFHAREAALKLFRRLDVSCSPKVRSLVRTSLLHPSSWEGWTTGGAFIYVRFRHGRLWIGLAPDRGIAPTMLFVARYPGEQGNDGFLRFETLMRLTEGIVDWP